MSAYWIRHVWIGPPNAEVYGTDHVLVAEEFRRVEGNDFLSVSRIQTVVR